MPRPRRVYHFSMTQAGTTTHLLYLHGFRSSPQSAKSRLMAQWVAREHADATWWCPQLPVSPREAMDMLLRGVADWPRAHMAVVGSSLGGYYATRLAEALGCRAVLLNPAVFAARDLSRHVGTHALWHDPQQHIAFTAAHVEELRALECAGPADPSRYFLLAAKGDEVLDWREMTARYPGVQLRLLETGDHGISDFEDHLAPVMAFLDLA